MRKAELGRERKHRKMDRIEEELLADDSEMEICEADLAEAEELLKRNQCTKCLMDFSPEYGMICKVDSTHAFCITCTYKEMVCRTSCPSGEHCTMDNEAAPWRFTSEEKSRASSIYFMMEVLPKAAREHLKSGNIAKLTDTLGMTYGEYMRNKKVKNPPACPACKLQIESSQDMIEHKDYHCRAKCVMHKEDFYAKLPPCELDSNPPPAQNWWKYQSKETKETLSIDRRALITMR